MLTNDEMLNHLPTYKGNPDFLQVKLCMHVIVDKENSLCNIKVL